MIQNILPKKLVNHYEEREPAAADKLMIFHGDKILIKRISECEQENRTDSAYNMKKIEYITYREYIDKYDSAGQKLQCCFLFSIAETSFFLIRCPEQIIDIMLAAEYEELPVKALREMQPQEYIFAGATAWHLYAWYRVSQFCGQCGEAMVHDNIERMMKCPACGNKTYPRINPAVIIGLRDGERLMMTKYSGRTYKNYALIAGFSEIGETVEETVAREVMEEVGLKVKNITYYKSQPWGFDSDLLMGYFCDLDGDDNIEMDSQELAVAEWMHYGDIPEQTNLLSLTAEMIMEFKHSWCCK